MKQILLLSLLLTCFQVLAQVEDPATFCDENPQCTDRMREITQGYKMGSNQISNEQLVGFSGACYHLSSMYDSSHEHHGSFIFERTNEALMADGIFNFFFEADPYQNMSSIELKNWFIQNGSRPSKATESESQVELQYLGDSSDYHYWFRNNKDLSKMYLIAKQASSDYLGFIYCEMNRR
jgi:hypothetical protein